MARYSELASKLLQDAAGFFDSLAEQNEPLKEQMLENANVYRQIGTMFAADPGGNLDEKTLAELTVKLLADAADFFETLGDQNKLLKEQMQENATVFQQMAKLIEENPHGELVGSAPAEPNQTPSPKAASAAPAPAPAAQKPNPKETTPAPPPHPDKNPLSARNIRLNGHTNFVDPVIGLSFPTQPMPRPITAIWPGSGQTNKREAVIGRANHICHYCGFRSQKYQQTAGPYDAVTNSEAHAACIMCAQVMALDTVPAMRSGVLIHLPEMGQAELHVFARIIYVCRISQGKQAELAGASLDKLMERRAKARSLFGTDDPFVLANELAEAGNRAEYDAITNRAREIRLLPLDRRIISEADLEFNQFPQILAYWRSKDGPFGGLAPLQMDMGTFRDRIEGIFGPFDIAA